MRHLHKLGATAFDDLYTVIGVSAYLLSILLKAVSTDPKELSDKIADRVNSFGIYTSFEEDLEDFDKVLDTDRSIFEVDSRYHNNCSLVIQMLDKTELP